MIVGWVSSSIESPKKRDASIAANGLYCPKWTTVLESVVDAVHVLSRAWEWPTHETGNTLAAVWDAHRVWNIIDDGSWTNDFSLITVTTSIVIATTTTTIIAITIATDTIVIAPIIITLKPIIPIVIISLSDSSSSTACTKCRSLTAITTVAPSCWRYIRYELIWFEANMEITQII